MKVCFLYHRPYKVLKKDSRVLKEAKSLLKSGYEVIILYNGKKTINKRELKAFNITIPCRAAWKRSNPKLWYLLWTFITIIITQLKRIRINIFQPGLILVASGSKIRANIYHAHDFETLLAGYILKKINDAVLIYDAHELTMEGTSVIGANSISKRIIRSLEIFLAKRCDYVITVNDSIAKIMSKEMNIRKPIVIKNLSPYIPENNIKNRDIRSKIGINKKAIIIIYIGGIKRGRGVEKIVNTAKQFSDIHFVLMGPMKEQLDFNVQNIHVLPPVPPEQVIQWISSCNVGFYPMLNISKNHYYSLGNKIGEYIMAGLPIAVSDFPEMHKFAVDEDLGVVFNPENQKDIVKSINKLLEPKIYIKKKQNIMKARKKYCWENEEKKLIQIYKKLEIRMTKVH